MDIDIDLILERIKSVNIQGMVNIERRTVGKEKQPVAEIDFLRLKGALKKDKTQIFAMILGDNSPDEKLNDLIFIVPNIDECESYSKALTLYMDANRCTPFGAYKWDPEGNRISLTYFLPLPEPACGYPDTPLLQRILVSIYEKLLFPEVKSMKWSIGEDDMLNKEEKEAKKSGWMMLSLDCWTWAVRRKKKAFEVTRHSNPFMNHFLWKDEHE